MSVVVPSRAPALGHRARPRRRRGLRLTRAVFQDLGIWMIGLGLLAGVAFPFFVLLLGVRADQALTVPFFGATLLAGLLVGAANWSLARAVIGLRLRTLSRGMQYVGGAIRTATETGDWSACNSDDCLLPVDSDDELGDAAEAFNGLVGALERSHEVESAIRDLFRTLSSRLELEPLAETALDWVAGHVGADAGALLLCRDGELHPVARQGGIDAAALCALPELRRTLDPPHAAATVGHLRGLPIVFASQPLAVLVLSEIAALDGEALRVLDLFTQAFAVALHNALAHARTQELALRDPLTGCANRRHGLERLSGELEDADRLGTRVGVLMIDLDHFKRVNDSYGHLAGDRVILHAAAEIRACLRAGDLLVRYGGEEFLAILPDARDDALPAIAERIRARLAATPVELSHGAIRVTASVGAARSAATGDEAPAALLDAADQALYRAKAAGRNTVRAAA
jgi:diguanylate cyclase (GGDEF)-like protein